MAANRRVCPYRLAHVRDPVSITTVLRGSDPYAPIPKDGSVVEYALNFVGCVGEWCQHWHKCGEGQG